MPARVTRHDLAALSAYLDAGSMKDAAVLLGVSPGTLHGRLVRLHVKVDTRTTAQAVYALRHEIAHHRGDCPPPAYGGPGREEGPEGTERRSGATGVSSGTAEVPRRQETSG
jgi:hypothetical protein